MASSLRDLAEPPPRFSFAIHSPVSTARARGPRLDRLAIVAAAWVLLALVGSLQAETVFLGPLPYLSAADSPFDLSRLGSTFFLEDFEDGVLNTPGISQPPSPAPQAFVRIPGPGTDSVDADDGLMDGFGSNGHSLQATNVSVNPSIPPRVFQSITLLFSDEVAPNAFGFVWTGGVPGTRLSFYVYDSEIRKIGEQHYLDLAGNDHEGETVEDRFFGVVTDQPIGAVGFEIFNFGDSRWFEMDHVQYGTLIPEPSAIVIVVTLATTTLATCGCNTEPLFLKQLRAHWR